MVASDGFRSPAPPSSSSDEVAFLEQGLREVQRAAQAVYMENMDLRARFELVRALTTKMAEVSGLPGDLQADIQTVLDSAIPPHGVLEEYGDPERKESDKDGGPSDHSYTFASRIQSLYAAMDRCRDSVYSSWGPKGQGMDGPPDAGSAGPECEPAPEGECSGPPALTENGENLWWRTKLICQDLLEGWCD